ADPRLGRHRERPRVARRDPRPRSGAGRGARLPAGGAAGHQGRSDAPPGPHRASRGRDGARAPQGTRAEVRMIRINLVPQNKRAARAAAPAGGGQVWAAVYFFGTLVFMGILAVVYFAKDGELSEQLQANQQLSA